jgi:hypothetical protein
MHLWQSGLGDRADRRGHFNHVGDPPYIANTAESTALAKTPSGDAHVKDALAERRSGCAKGRLDAAFLASNCGPRQPVDPAALVDPAAFGAAPQRPRPARRPVECGDLPFLIRRDGSWLYRGSPIGRKELVCLFSSVLKREEDGSFWLETPAERGRIQVEDAPFVAVELDWSGDGQDQVLSFRTNIDQVITAGPDHPIRVAHDIITCEPTPYLNVRPGAGHLAVEARINRAVYYELVALAVPEMVGCRRMLGVWSRRRFFPLGEMPTCADAAERLGDLSQVGGTAPDAD